MNRVHRYAFDVIQGKQITGKSVKRQSLKHLKDLKASELDTFPWFFDEAEANAAIAFAEALRFTEGHSQGQNFKAADFQAFIIGMLFGWKSKETKRRRFKKSYIQLARKQAKTYIVSIIALYMAEFCGYKKAQIYTTATASKQSRIAFNNIKNFIEMEPDLRARLLGKILERDMLIRFKSGSTIQALSGNTGNIDGFQPFLGIVDEYHAHSSNQMLKLLEDGQVQIPDALMLIITTAGFNTNGACYKEYEYARAVLAGDVKNDRYFSYIAELDDDDDEFDPQNWLKACPLAYEVPAIIEALKDKATEVKDKNAEDLLNFRVKSINKWTHFSGFKFLSPEALEQAKDVRDLAEFSGERCVIGVDLSESGDLTAVAALIEDSQRGGWFGHQKSFMPSAMLEERAKLDKVPYQIFEERGLIQLTNNASAVDYSHVLAYICELRDIHGLDIVAIAYDPYRFTQLALSLEAEGFTVMPVRPTAVNLTEPTILMRSAVEDGRFCFNELDELLIWSFKNAEVINVNGGMKIDKRKRNQKIDVADAFVNCFKYVCASDFEAFDAIGFNNSIISDLYS